MKKGKMLLLKNYNSPSELEAKVANMEEKGYKVKTRTTHFLYGPVVILEK